MRLDFLGQGLNWRLAAGLKVGFKKQHMTYGNNQRTSCLSNRCICRILYYIDILICGRRPTSTLYHISSKDRSLYLFCIRLIDTLKYIKMLVQKGRQKIIF